MPSDNTPADALQPTEYFESPVLAAVYNLAHTWGSYHTTEQKLGHNACTLDAILSVVTKGFTLGNAPQASPAPHFAFSSRLDGKDQLMASHGLPVDASGAPTIIPGVNAPVDYKVS